MGHIITNLNNKHDVKRAIDKMTSIGYGINGTGFFERAMINAEYIFSHNRCMYIRGVGDSIHFGTVGNGIFVSDYKELKLGVRSKRKNFKEWCKDVK